MNRSQDLFGNDTSFESYRMPQPQYLGAKHNLMPWIAKFIPSGVSTILDGFSGSSSASYHFKKMGLQVISNDFLKSCSGISKALIENTGKTLNEDDLQILFSNNASTNGVMQNFKDIFFIEEECSFLDGFRINVEKLKCEYKQALALSVMNRSLTRKTIMGHFAHMQAIAYANNEDRVKRNPSIARKIKDLFLELLPDYNNAIFDNGKENRSYNENILELLPKLKNVEVAYFDPPYAGSHADYQSFYHLLETFSQNWQDKEFINGTKRYFPYKYSGFDKVKEIDKSFEALFEKANNIPIWLISYNDRSIPDIKTLANLISRFKKEITVEEKMYTSSRGGKGSVNGSKEYLIVCK
jgi:adenine-specific DNA-methyltransferase